MAFKSSFSIAEEGQIHRKVIMLMMAIVVLIALFIKIAWDFGSANTTLNIIEIKMLDRNQIIVATDTTNYEEFASTLKNAVIQAQKSHDQNKILLTVPKKATSSEIADIVMVVTAMNINWQLSTI